MKKHYGGLRVKTATTIVGAIRFRAMKISNGEIGIWHELPSQDTALDPLFIEDVYEIEIVFNPDDFVPIVREIGGRLEKRAHEMDGDILKLHVFPKSKILCLGKPLSMYLELQKNPCIENFFEKFLIPYLYYHSHVEKYGKEPWPGLPHHEIPVFEDFYRYRKSVSADTISITLKHLHENMRLLLEQGKRNPNKRCLCGSNKKAKACHPLALKGFNILSRKIRLGKFGLSERMQTAYPRLSLARNPQSLSNFLR